MMRLLCYATPAICRRLGALLKRYMRPRLGVQQKAGIARCITCRLRLGSPIRVHRLIDSGQRRGYMRRRRFTDTDSEAGMQVTTIGAQLLLNNMRTQIGGLKDPDSAQVHEIQARTAEQLLSLQQGTQARGANLDVKA
jgi:hypothetical protein